MFVGHYGVSFAAAAQDPTLPLPALMVSTQILDIAWSSFVLMGVEKLRVVPNFTATNDLDLYYLPYSHGLIAAAAWSVAAGAAAYYFSAPHAILGAALMAAVCFSHWLLDLLVHVPDLPLVGNRYKVGFGLWNYRIAAFGLELAILFAGAAIYAGSRGGFGSAEARFIFGLSIVLALVQGATVFGPRPASVRNFALSALFSYAAIPAIAWAGLRVL